MQNIDTIDGISSANPSSPRFSGPRTLASIIAVAKDRIVAVRLPVNVAVMSRFNIIMIEERKIHTGNAYLEVIAEKK